MHEWTVEAVFSSFFGPHMSPLLARFTCILVPRRGIIVCLAFRQIEEDKMDANYVLAMRDLTDSRRKYHHREEKEELHEAN